MSCPDCRQIQTEGRAGQVRERAGEVVEAFGLGNYGGDGDGRLEGVGEGDGRDEGGEEGAGEGGGMEEGGENGHCLLLVVYSRRVQKEKNECYRLQVMNVWECLLYVP